jgi:hypothetical protein
MSDAQYLLFKGVSSLYKENILTNLQYGMVDWLNWAFLNIGGFQNIQKNPQTYDINNIDKTILRPVNDVRYPSGTVFEGFRGNWVWETGINFASQPIHSSGVWINNTFYEAGNIAYPYYVDYPRGRIVFDIPVSGTVETEFAHRTIGILPADNPWCRTLMYDSFDVSRDFIMSNSGTWNRWSDVRCQLPTIAVDANTKYRMSPYQVGGGQWVDCDISLYIYGETDIKQIVDVLSMQNDRVIWLPDRSTMKLSGVFPPAIGYDGKLKASPLQFPDLVVDENSPYRWQKVYLKNVHPQIPEPINDWLHTGIVEFTCEMVFENI